MVVLEVALLNQSFTTLFVVKEIDLIHYRITNLQQLHLERFTELKKLSFRQNLIGEIECLHDGLAKLEELDFYDNRLSKIENLESLKGLLKLDLSFNNIRVIENVHQLKELKEVYFVANKLSSINNLDALTNLTTLELGANRIKVEQNCCIRLKSILNGPGNCRNWKTWMH